MVGDTASRFPSQMKAWFWGALQKRCEWPEGRWGLLQVPEPISFCCRLCGHNAETGDTHTDKE